MKSNAEKNMYSLYEFEIEKENRKKEQIPGKKAGIKNAEKEHKNKL